MNISLPESMKAWIEEQVAVGGYGTVSEFFRQLIREAQQQLTREQIDAKLLEAIESGRRIEVTDRYWEQKRQQLTARTKQSKDR